MIQQFGESLESRWYREHSIKAHKRHLKEISLRSKSTIRSPEQTKIVNLRKLSQEFDKQREIERENFLLFLRLNTIKERKISPRESFGPKSLNISVRRKEAEKIMNENYGYVKRFIEMPSFVSARRHIEEYQMQKEYKKTISKANLHRRLEKLSSFVAKPGFLPPLEISGVDSQVKIRSENISKLDTIEDNDAEKIVKSFEESEKIDGRKERLEKTDKSEERLKKTVEKREKTNESGERLKKSRKKDDSKEALVKSIDISETQIIPKVDTDENYEKESFEESPEPPLNPITDPDLSKKPKTPSEDIPSPDPSVSPPDPNPS